MTDKLWPAVALLPAASSTSSGGRRSPADPWVMDRSVSERLQRRFVPPPSPIGNCLQSPVRCVSSQALEMRRGSTRRTGAPHWLYCLRVGNKSERKREKLMADENIIESVETRTPTEVAPRPLRRQMFSRRGGDAGRIRRSRPTRLTRSRQSARSRQRKLPRAQKPELRRKPPQRQLRPSTTLRTCCSSNKRMRACASVLVLILSAGRSEFASDLLPTFWWQIGLAMSAGAIG